jgi:hypothetical protein
MYWNIKKQKLFEDIMQSVFSGCIRGGLSVIIHLENEFSERASKWERFCFSEDLY